MKLGDENFVVMSFPIPEVKGLDSLTEAERAVAPLAASASSVAAIVDTLDVAHVRPAEAADQPAASTTEAATQSSEPQALQ